MYIIPDFATEAACGFELYLVNTDTDLFRWVNSEVGLLPHKEEEYIGWTQKEHNV